MAQKIRLTWKTSQGDITKEECLLVSENDTILPKEADVRTHDFNLFAAVAKKGLVIFEDDEGIFFLDPEDIINIEVIRNNQK